MKVDIETRHGRCRGCCLDDFSMPLVLGTPFFPSLSHNVPCSVPFGAAFLACSLVVDVQKGSHKRSFFLSFSLLEAVDRQPLSCRPGSGVVIRYKDPAVLYTSPAVIMARGDEVAKQASERMRTIPSCCITARRKLVVGSGRNITLGTQQKLDSSARQWPRSGLNIFSGLEPAIPRRWCCPFSYFFPSLCWPRAMTLRFSFPSFVQVSLFLHLQPFICMSERALL